MELLILIEKILPLWSARLVRLPKQPKADDDEKKVNDDEKQKR